ncbi:LytR/AlgR family response regulator transcription factor [Janibacter melonis]|uniref:LytR/AlgR family response regulator transcription factor n=1 Tax=Janibacter melonis TaxID=262209 RepID=UPI002095E353|nr:LytTR family DNA-binding domain-containing protein [Janibacter melonis]
MAGGSEAPGDGLVVLVVDDEAPARGELAWVLDQAPRVSRVLAAPSGTAALAALEHESIDVVFSDISMPGLDGMQLARVIKRFADPPAVVFVTAHDAHAVDAFDLDAVDYVMKPVRQERIGEAVRRCLVSIERADRTGEDDDETIPVELGGVTRFVSRADIRYVQAHGDYARLHTATGSHLVRVPLASLEERWSEAGFVRIHRSTIVSTRHVTQVRMDQGRCTVVVDGDVELQVSRRHTRALRSTLLRLGERP